MPSFTVSNGALARVVGGQIQAFSGTSAFCGSIKAAVIEGRGKGGTESAILLTLDWKAIGVNVSGTTARHWLATTTPVVEAIRLNTVTIERGAGGRLIVSDSLYNLKVLLLPPGDHMLVNTAAIHGLL